MATKTKNREYFGSSLAEPLCKWLNNSRDSDNRRDVLKLISIAQDWQATRNRHERELLKGRANDILLDFKFNPVLVDVKGTLRVLWGADEYGTTAEYMRILLELLQKGLLPTLKRCNYEKCGKWFFAKFNHNDFHSKKCREAKKKADKNWRTHRKEYEKEYYKKYLSKAAKEGARP